MSEQEQDGSSSVDSELAALLDEELFHDDPAEAAEQQEEADMAEAAATAQADHSEQQAKRARWTQQQQPGASDDGADSVEDMSEGSEGVGAAVTAVAAQQEEYVCPPHPGWWQGLCIRCGAERRADEPEARHQQHAAAHNASRAPRVKIRHLSNKQPLEVCVRGWAQLVVCQHGRLSYFGSVCSEAGSATTTTTITTRAAAIACVCSPRTGRALDAALRASRASTCQRSAQLTPPIASPPAHPLLLNQH